MGFVYKDLGRWRGLAWGASGAGGDDARLVQFPDRTNSCACLTTGLRIREQFRNKKPSFKVICKESTLLTAQIPTDALPIQQGFCARVGPGARFATLLFGQVCENDSGIRGTYPREIRSPSPSRNHVNEFPLRKIATFDMGPNRKRIIRVIQMALAEKEKGNYFRRYSIGRLDTS